MIQTQSDTVTISFDISCFQIGELNPQLQKITDILDSIKEKVKPVPDGRWLMRALLSPELSCPFEKADSRPARAAFSDAGRDGLDQLTRFRLPPENYGGVWITYRHH